MVVNGANDPYWTTDAHGLYWNDLKQPKWLVEVPNSGHGLQDINRVVSSVGALARSVDGQFKMPTVSAKRMFSRDNTSVSFDVTCSRAPASIRVWSAESESKNFSGSQWISATFMPGQEPKISPTPGKFCAAFVEATFTIQAKSFTLTTPVEIFRVR
jgi:PhoPQ-activated pathogenicity-related protein